MRHRKELARTRREIESQVNVDGSAEDGEEVDELAGDVESEPVDGEDYDWEDLVKVSTAYLLKFEWLTLS